MKLELKHLSGYLSHGLKMQLLGFPFEKTFGIHVRTLELDCGHDFHFYLKENKVRPILHPLSDYEKFDEIVLEMSNYYMSMIDENPDMVKRLPYDVIELMFKNHIDIHGLIKEGLAIDINTLQN